MPATRKSLMTIDEASRTDLYKKGLARIVSDKKILRGEPVFRGTRLSVRHIGGMRLNGEPTHRILEDYPDLSAEDVEFAALYTTANPASGRARANAKR
jgi:uncharacterized protein (DUF433 family)